MTEPRHLDERLLDALDTWQQDAEEQAKKVLALVDELDEIRERHERGETTDEDVKKLKASIGAESAPPDRREVNP